MIRRSLSLFCLLAAITAAGCSRKETIESSAGMRYPGAPVIIISVDTLRADHLPAYGYGQVETPNIDALRKDGVLFRNAWAHVPLTLPSHASILTGLLPHEHGVRNNIGYPFDGTKHRTLPDMLRGSGYESGAAISSYVLRGATGLSHGFDYYDDAIASREGVAISALQRSGSTSAQLAQQWIEPRAAKPFFFLLHLFEPHTPYDPPEPFRSKYANRYDGEIAAADAVVGSFIEFLKQRGIYDRAIIIFLSDHGEGLGDHGEDEHGTFLYRESIQVPLIVKLPESALASSAVDAPVQLIDIVPTITSLTGSDAPKLRGESLFAVASDAKRAPRRIFSESMYPRIHLGWSELRSLVDDRYHFIEAPRPELYDMASDPAEKNNVLASNRRVYAAMRKEVAEMNAVFSAPGNVDPEEAAKLQALGYLGSTASASAGGSLPDPKDRIGEIEEMKRAFGLASAGRPEEAVALLRNVVAKNPRFADAWNKLGITLMEMGRYEEALEAYKSAAKTEPSLASEYALSIGSVLFQLERYDEAAAHAELGRRANPASAEILLSRVKVRQGNVDEAVQHARKAAADPNFKWTATVALVEALTAQGNLDEALRLAENTRNEIAAGSGTPVEGLDFVRGDLFARMERYREAEAAFMEEIRNFPKHRQTYANLALVLMIQGRVEEARRLYEAMAKATPGRETYLFAARTAARLGDAPAAKQWEQRAVRARDTQ